MPRPVREIPWLEQRNGVYNVHWYEPPTEEQKRRNPRAKGQTKRLGLRTRDPGEAQARFAAFLATGYHKQTADGQLTVVAGLDLYDRHVEENVVDKKRARVVIRHLAEFFGDMPFSEVGIAECESYTEARLKGEINGSAVGRTTAHRELVVLRAAAHYARKRKLISLDKMPTFEFPAKYEARKVSWFTKDELAELLRRAEGKLRDLVVLTYAWGARRASVERLETCQVHLDTALVRLQKVGQKVTNRPEVPIYPEIRETLERLVREAEDGRWLFGPRYDCHFSFSKLCRDCGFEKHRQHPHMLRHSRATHMLMDGESIYDVAALLGDSPLTIQKVYGHHSVAVLASKGVPLLRGGLVP